MVLVGIVAGFTVPRLDWARWEADAGVRQLRYTLQSAQRLAITQQSTVIVGVDSARWRLRILEDVNGDRAASAGEHVTWRQLDGGVRFVTPPSPLPGAVAGGALVNVGPSVVDGLPSLVFRRDGSASASAILYIRSQRRGDKAYRGITVTQATGRVAWWRASGNGSSVAWKKGTL
jgi:hypothetical protein